MQSLAVSEQDAPRARRVVRDLEYSWGNTTMMNLYSGTTDPFSHRCRIVLFEKGMDFQVIDVDLFNKPRFPHPQLMPPDPIMRARARQLLHTFELELFSHIEALEKNPKGAEKERAHVRDQLTQLAPMFTKQKFLLGDEFSMLDVAIAPLLWRLDHYGIELPRSAAPLMKYAERIFSRQGFIDAMTPSEKVMRR